MLYNNVDMTEHMKIMAIRGRGLTGQELTTIRVPGSDKEYVSYREKPTRYLEIDFEVRAKSKEELRKKIDELSAIIETSEEVPIIFSDESDRTYFGEYAGVEESTEYHHVGIHRGTIYILRDKYKYGPEKSLRFPADIVEVENEGTAETEPIFELTAKEKTTFAMVSNGDDEDSQYNLIGRPADIDVEVVDTKTSVLYENGSTLDTWQPASLDMVDTFFIDSIGGEMVFDGAGLRPNGYGTGEKQHGPAVFKELPESIQDFELESTFDIISNRKSEAFRMVIYFHDENMNNLGQIGIKDNSSTFKRRIALGRVGHYRGGGANNGNVIGDHSWVNDNAMETTLFYLRVRREGNRYTFYIGEWRNQRHDNIWEGSFNDVNNQWAGKLKYITLFIGKHGDLGAPGRMRINSVEVFKLKSIVEDQTPYILYPGDNVEFDHKNDDILVNGEPRNDLKNFGGSFFKLKKGKNRLIVTPEDSFDTRITFRAKYL